jgi:hypothetical protein
MPSSRPSTTIARALTIEPCASATDVTRPRNISEKYSAGPNFSAMPVSGGARTARKSVATVPAKNEPSAAAASAWPACPWRAIWYPSIAVTADEDSPGRLTRIAVVEPPYCAP